MMSVNVTQWLNEQKESDKNLYIIVDPKSAHQPHVVFYQCDGIDGGPLMSPEALTNPEDGPWLLPVTVNARFLDWWQQSEHANSGILIATDSSYKALREYFAGLFQAIIQGEKVFFPFYKPDDLATMLPRLDPEEVTLLLKNHRVLIRHDEQWLHWQSKRPSNQNQSKSQIQNEPWWVIKTHHLDGAPNLPLLSRNVETWLWQHQSHLMQSRIEQGLPDFNALFQTHFTALESIPNTQAQALTVQEKTLTASVLTLYGQATLIQPSIQDDIAKLKDDELLFGLTNLFSQLQGKA
ncbi:DUF4123 domain-containing protein [Vibrio sp. YMD68]|uniref:DUF4123 domain-containing protein n=1 Tax=Vibrio sp. YMD68 TaxID=3042300 RepID=UPI00249BE87A|nr:DUF4123 domain-containing protein [Vibrio sp. YMD68]WGW00173.1 DUF4123 domain-containing protein [Vibrio sp. YMD68]WGW01277.1 DUF4123 domain-containing protein [Vibrio sp. YMD68]